MQLYSPGTAIQACTHRRVPLPSNDVHGRYVCSLKHHIENKIAVNTHVPTGEI